MWISYWQIIIKSSMIFQNFSSVSIHLGSLAQETCRKWAIVINRRCRRYKSKDKTDRSTDRSIQTGLETVYRQVYRQDCLGVICSLNCLSFGVNGWGRNIIHNGWFFTRMITSSIFNYIDTLAVDCIHEPLVDIICHVYIFVHRFTGQAVLLCRLSALLIADTK